MTKKLLALLLAGVVAIGATACGSSVEYEAGSQEERISQFANPEKFITADQLAELMESGDDVAVVGVEVGNKLIEGSLAIDEPEWTEPVYVERDRASAEKMAETLGTNGITEDTIIVAYGEGSWGPMNAARFLWQVDMLGHEDMMLLEGGYDAWEAAGYETANSPIEVEEVTYVPADDNVDALAEIDTVRAAIGDDEWIILDTRSDGEWDNGTIGEENTVHIEWSNFFDENFMTLSIDELEELVSELDADKNIIPFCGVGFRSAHTTYMLKYALGYENVYNYDGSWEEWVLEN